MNEREKLEETLRTRFGILVYGLRKTDSAWHSASRLFGLMTMERRGWFPNSACATSTDNWSATPSKAFKWRSAMHATWRHLHGEE